MRILLTSSQLQAVSEFCVDVAKGLMLAAILGQGVAGASFVFLYAGVLLKRK